MDEQLEKLLELRDLGILTLEYGGPHTSYWIFKVSRYSYLSIFYREGEPLVYRKLTTKGWNTISLEEFFSRIFDRDLKKKIHFNLDVFL